MLSPSDLHVVAVYSNPRRFVSIVRLLHQFIPRMLASGVSLTIVEHAFGDREFEFSKGCAELAGVNHVQARGGANHELWIKEALIKIGVRTLPDNWKYLAWVDSDVHFLREDWALETLHMLQHHRLGQPWTHAIDLDPHGNVMRNEWGNDVDRSFAAAGGLRAPCCITLAGDARRAEEGLAAALWFRLGDPPAVMG
jgi:hypothetical protein